MKAKNTSSTIRLQLEALESREAPSASPWLVENFDSTSLGSLPWGWSQWSSSGYQAFRVGSNPTVSGGHDLAASASISNLTSRAWTNTLAPADVQVSANIYLDSLSPAQVVLRGTGLNSATSTYYALSVTRGLQLQLLRVIDGNPAVLATAQSANYVSGTWVRLTLASQGSTLQGQVYRLDTGQYLSSSGQWQSAPAWAFTRIDTAITGIGQVGLARPAGTTGTVSFDNFCVVWPKSDENFDHTPAGSLPAGWTQWSNTGNAVFGTSSANALSLPNGLLSSVPTSSTSGRAWLNLVEPADVQVSAAIFVNNLVPAQVFVRGNGLDTPNPSYYAVSIRRGIEVELLRVIDGNAAWLAQVQSTEWVSGQWIHVGLSVSGSMLRVQIFRLDKALYLNSAGQWQTQPTWAISRSDVAITGAGEVGVARPASVTGTVTFDDFSTFPYFVDTNPPTVTIAGPQAGATLAGMSTLQALANDDVGVAKVEFYLDNLLAAVQTAGPYSWNFDTTRAANGSHSLTVLAYDWSGNVGQSSVNINVQNGLAVPVIPRHYPHIRIAELAYSGNPMGAFEDQLLRASVDLVVPDNIYLTHIAAVAPNTPRLSYLNVSNLYLSLLTSWLNYADSHGLSREEAFYHVPQATPFTGDSPSSQPVNWFWAVFQGASTWTDWTYQAHGPYSSGVPFGSTGQSIVIGYPDRFREINLTLASGAANGWSSVLEYPVSVDSLGRPTAWAYLNALSNTTGGLTRSGQMLFDPPANWVPASINGSARLYFARFRTTAGGTAPVARSILGRDYVGANGTTWGVIPAFDAAADVDHDGYLNDAEYARRASGKNARFLYESRLFYGNYGQMRFVSNPSDPGYRNWAVDYAVQDLNNLPLATGLFMDNSGGRPPFNTGATIEPATNFAADYGSLLRAIGRAIGPRWILANTAGGGTMADTVASQIPAYYEEFAIRPLANNYQQFLDLADTVARRAASSPAPYAILDSLPAGGSPSDPRTQLATLAYYYLLANLANTFLDFFGGYEPAGSWTRHWVPAAAFDIGQPLGSWSLFASGRDPDNWTLTYQVYQRHFTNALVLYKPLSYGANVTGSTSDNTATTFFLPRGYHPLNADGTLGPVVTRITLRNGEGAILI
jgi:hypothetical protein